jgi:hypothetical protein
MFLMSKYIFNIKNNIINVCIEVINDKNELYKAIYNNEDNELFYIFVKDIIENNYYTIKLIENDKLMLILKSNNDYELVLDKEYDINEELVKENKYLRNLINNMLNKERDLQYIYAKIEYNIEQIENYLYKIQDLEKENNILEKENNRLTKIIKSMNK